MTDPTEMELRVAKALSRSDAFDPTHTDEDYVNMARAAIRAMREPTKEMMDAYLDAEPMLDDEGWNGAPAKDAWQAMIDAASPAND